LREEKDQFANPVGCTISNEIAALYDELLQGTDTEKLSPFLERIIRIRAVQDFSPSQAIGFIFSLKRVIRDELGSEIRKDGIVEELTTFESRIDELALRAFEIYVRCRERVYEIRVNEVKNRTFGLLKRANLLYEFSEEESNSEDGKVDSVI
jgi:hypothetical protein